MKLNIDNKDYLITFEYRVNHIELGGKDVPCYTTVCQIESKEFVIESLGYAHCNVNDRFIKEIGRKISLKKALEKLYPTYAMMLAKNTTGFNEEYDIQSKSIENKQKRTLFWKAYLARKN